MPRHAGVILPLFSAVSTESWGIGELLDVVPLAAWLEQAGFDRLMLLPIGTMPPGGTSPYSAVSAMAIDPIFLRVPALEDFWRAGGESALSSEARQALAAARQSPHISYADVRRVKDEALDTAFACFVADEWQTKTARGASLAAFIARERWWLDDYALFQAIAAHAGTGHWWTWPAALAARDPRALDEARRQLARDVLRHQYLQWAASDQWQRARAAAQRHGVRIVGDVPFVVAAESADVWARSGEFLLDVSAGVPPDAFSDTGQDWSLPTYRWDVIAAGGFAWMRQRVQRMTALFDSARIDHLVGFYRTYGRRRGEPGFFIPPDEPTQLWQGEQILTIALASGLEILAEDLGTVPDFVRASMARLGVPGSKVLRWERYYHQPGQPFVDPAELPIVSAAFSGTHDTEPVAVWWDGASATDRAGVASLPTVRAAGTIDPSSGWSETVRDVLLASAYHARSDHLFCPMQDVFGWRDRINTPATVGDANWTWRLPWPIDAFERTAAATERAAFCRAASVAAGRVLSRGSA